MREFLSKLVTRRAFELVHDLSNRQSRGKRRKQMDVIWHHDQLQNFTVKLRSVKRNQLSQAFTHVTSQYRASILWAPYKMIIDVVSRVMGSFGHNKRIVSPLSNGGNAPFSTRF